MRSGVTLAAVLGLLGGVCVNATFAGTYTRCNAAKQRAFTKFSSNFVALLIADEKGTATDKTDAMYERMMAGFALSCVAAQGNADCSIYHDCEALRFSTYDSLEAWLSSGDLGTSFHTGSKCDQRQMKAGSKLTSCLVKGYSSTKPFGEIVAKCSAKFQKSCIKAVDYGDCEAGIASCFDQEIIYRNLAHDLNDAIFIP